MKRHQHWLGIDRKPRGCKSLRTILTAAALAQLSACGSDPQKHGRLAGVRDNASLLLIENSFFEGDGHPQVEGSTLYYLLMNDPISKESRAYAIDCAGKNIAALASAFGVDSSTPYPGSDTFEDLELYYKISQQPILRCSSVNPSSNNMAIHKVFQLVDDRTEDKKKEKPLPQLFVRFNNVAANDTVNQEQFYSIGCRDILNSFGSAGQKSLAEAVPILASSVSSIFPDFEKHAPLNCTSNTLDPLLNKAPKRVDDLAMKVSQSVTDKNLEFYRVMDALNPQKTLSYLVGQGSDYSRVLCFNIPDSEIKAALNFPPTYATQDLKSDDIRFINSRSRPELECVNLQTRDRFESRWTSVRTAPAVHYYKKKNAKTLYRFGCASAENYFTAGLNLAQNPIELTSDLVDYLTLTPSSGYKVVTFPCAGGGLTRDPAAIQVGEVISLKLPSAPANKSWLNGNTSSAEVKQVGTQTIGTYWFVHSAGEVGSFHLQALGQTPSLSYLACPLQGDVPRLVSWTGDGNHITKWSSYRGDGSGTVRLGCTDASGKIRFLHGGGTATLLGDDATAAEAATNWLVQHQSFVEDSSLLQPNQAVSMFALLSPHERRWLAAYPGASTELGLEPNNSSAATYFRVGSRKDSRGVSLESLNSGSGDRLLDCKPEVDKRGFELAPTAEGGYIGTGFRAFRLSNSNLPIFKLACFDSSNKIPYWMSMTDTRPWLRADMTTNISDRHSIMYLQVRPNEPAPPGSQPRRESIPRFDFILENKCSEDLDTAILSFDTAWTTKTVKIKSKSSHTVPVQNQYTYYLTSGNFSGEKSDVHIKFRDSWQQAFEFSHRYVKKPDGSSTWYNRLIFCP